MKNDNFLNADQEYDTVIQRRTRTIKKLRPDMEGITITTMQAEPQEQVVEEVEQQVPVQVQINQAPVSEYREPVRAPGQEVMREVDTTHGVETVEKKFFYPNPQPVMPPQMPPVEEPPIFPRLSQQTKEPTPLIWITIAAIAVVVLILTGYVIYVWEMQSKTTPAPSKTQTSAFFQSLQNQQAQQTQNYQAFPTPVPTSQPTIVTNKPSISQTATTLKVLTTPTGYLNVRDLPDQTGTLLTKVHPGETYVYKNYKQGWYEIILPDQTTGWVSEQYVQKLK